MIWLIGDLPASNHHVSGCFFGFAMRLVLKLAHGVLLTRCSTVTARILVVAEYREGSGNIMIF
jgi:hypothetical protein